MFGVHKSASIGESILYNPEDVQEIDITQEVEWNEPLVVSFDKQASLEIARYVLIIFGTIYALSFLLAVKMLALKDVTFDSALELVKFLLNSIIPLVTLAVGYYLGDRTTSNSSD